MTIRKKVISSWTRSAGAIRFFARGSGLINLHQRCPGGAPSGADSAASPVHLSRNRALPSGSSRLVRQPPVGATAGAGALTGAEVTAVLTPTEATAPSTI